MSHATRTRDLRRDRARPRAFSAIESCSLSLREHPAHSAPEPLLPIWG